MISGLTYRLKGTDGWETDKEHKVTIYGNGTQTEYNVQTITFSLDNDASKTLDAGDLFKRKITGVGDFDSAVSLTLSENSGYYTYTYTYDGTVVDQYAPLSVSRNKYNCYQHTDAPTLVFTCDTPVVNGHDYQQYFRAGINTISIDRDGLYAAMMRDGVTSVHATATLSFPERSTVSGAAWTKDFTISLPASVTVAENFENGAVKTEGEVSVQTQEDESYVSMTVDLGQNPGIWGIKNVISYDTSKLSLEGWSAETLASIYETKFNDAEGKFTFVAYRDSTSSSYQSGSFVTLTFKKLTDGIIVSELLTVETKEAINVKGENLSVNLSCEAGDSTSVPPIDENVYLTTDEEITDAIFAVLKDHSSTPLVLHYQTETLITAEMISAWYHAAGDLLNEYQQFGIQ